MPPAARIKDLHTCPEVEPGPVPHVGGPITTGAATVVIGFSPAARVTDKATCVPATDAIAAGAPTVFVGGQPAARLGDPTEHGGVVVSGCPTVNIGVSAQMAVLLVAAEAGIPFCEECSARALSEPAGAPPAEPG